MGALTGVNLQPKPRLTSDLFPGIQIGSEIPTSFIKSQTSININGIGANTIIARSPPVPDGFVGKIQDFNVNFSSTGTGSVQLVRITSSGQIFNTVLVNIAASQSGIGQTVLSSGEACAIVIDTAGTGTIESMDFTGILVFAGDVLN